jgi:hypothetical protein
MTQRKQWSWITGIGLSAALALAGCGSDTSKDTSKDVGDTSAALTGSSFESTDGNLVVNGGTGSQDWANAPNFQFKQDKATGSGDDSFGQGSKEDISNPSVVSGSIPNNKSDLTRFYVAHENASGTFFLYLGWERANILGSANMDFEFNKSSTVDANGVTPIRSPGDMLITFDFTNGGGNPVLGMLRWLVGDPTKDPAPPTGYTTSTCFSSNTFPCWGNRITLSDTIADGGVFPLAGCSTDADCAATPSGGTCTGPKNGNFNKTCATVDPTNNNAPVFALTFGEAAINLTAAGVFPPGQCVNFASAYLKSRSSASFTAELKDFIAPLNASITNCGTINLKKVISGTSTGLAGALFTVYSGVAADGTSKTCPSGGTLVGSCTTVSDGTCNPNPFTGLAPGTYCAQETTPPTGYAGDVAQSGTVSAGGTLNLTFSDKPLSKLTITKVDDGSNPVAGAVFKLYAGGTAANNCTDGTLAGQCTTGSDGSCGPIGNLLSGSYCLDETTVPPGYAKSSSLPDVFTISSDTTKSYTNPRLRYRIITIVCTDLPTAANNVLFPSLVSFGGATPVASLRATDATFTGLGVTQAALCGLRGASFGNQLVTTNPPGTGTPYSETVNIDYTPAP